MSHWYTTLEVPAGVVLGGIITGGSGYLANRRAARIALDAQNAANAASRKQSFDERYWEKTALAYEDVSKIITSIEATQDLANVQRLQRLLVSMKLLEASVRLYGSATVFKELQLLKTMFTRLIAVLLDDRLAASVSTKMLEDQIQFIIDLMSTHLREFYEPGN